MKDPDRCACGQRGRVIETKLVTIDDAEGYRRRRHRCTSCRRRWTTFQSDINPRQIVKSRRLLALEH